MTARCRCRCRAQWRLHGYAIEPSKGMSDQRPAFGPAVDFEWTVGSAEEPDPGRICDWVCMGTASHWTDGVETTSTSYLAKSRRCSLNRADSASAFDCHAHHEVMTAATYLDMWRSYHDVPRQIGSERWREILKPVLDRVAGRPRSSHSITLMHGRAGQSEPNQNWIDMGA